MDARTPAKATRAAIKMAATDSKILALGIFMKTSVTYILFTLTGRRASRKFRASSGLFNLSARNSQTKEATSVGPRYLIRPKEQAKACSRGHVPCG
jgi:hypothetical protein